MQTVKCHAMQGFKGTIVLNKGTYFLRLYLLLKIRLVLSSVLYFEKVWVFLLFVLISFHSGVIQNILFFLEKVLAKYFSLLCYFKLVRDSSIDLYWLYLVTVCVKGRAIKTVDISTKKKLILLVQEIRSLLILLCELP